MTENMMTGIGTNIKTFINFLKRYCVQLSGHKNFSYHVFEEEAISNPRVLEPFCVLCVYSNHLNSGMNLHILMECKKIQNAGNNWPNISAQYKKLYDAWIYAQNKPMLIIQTKQNARELITRKYNNNIPLTHIARMVGISYSALYKFFRKNQDNAISIGKLWDIYQLKTENNIT